VRGPLQVIAEVQAPCLHIAAHHLLQTRLVDGNTPVFQQLDLGRFVAGLWPSATK
jgi:hypothetical protein